MLSNLNALKDYYHDQMKFDRVKSSFTNRKLSETLPDDSMPQPTQATFYNQVLAEENAKLRVELEVVRQKLAAQQAKDKVLESQIWDLRRLMKRIAEEGYTQLRQVETEKEQMEEELEWIKSSYKYFQNYLGHFERVGLFWAEFVNGDYEN